MGRRVKKTVYVYNTDSWLLTSDSFFVYDGWNLIEELDADENVQKSYVWGLDLSQSMQGAGGVGGLLATVDDAVIYLYSFDGNGNVGQVIDASDGSVGAHYEYDPYGNLLNQSGAYADENVYRFSTKYFDQENSLYYYGYRYYSPEFGRWINRDPIAEEGGSNLYGFVNNIPINIYDILGEDFIAIAKRPLDMFPWVEKMHAGLNIHTSIEYWKCPCTIGGSHEYKKEDLKAICQVSGYSESVELLNSPNNTSWWIWEKKTKYIPYYGNTSYWDETKIGVSVIVFGNSQGRTLQAFYEPRDRDRDRKVAAEWGNIKTKALSYRYAEQENFKGNFKNWPNSNYQALGNNCHTFSKTMIKPNPIPDIIGHMLGNDTPKNIVDKWNGRIPVDNISKLGTHP